jgi:hypothetical protein
MNEAVQPMPSASQEWRLVCHPTKSKTVQHLSLWRYSVQETQTFNRKSHDHFIRVVIGHLKAHARKWHQRKLVLMACLYPACFLGVVSHQPARGWPCLVAWQCVHTQQQGVHTTGHPKPSTLFFPESWHREDGISGHLPPSTIAHIWVQWSTEPPTLAVVLPGEASFLLVHQPSSVTGKWIAQSNRCWIKFLIKKKKKKNLDRIGQLGKFKLNTDKSPTTSYFYEISFKILNWYIKA